MRHSAPFDPSVYRVTTFKYDKTTKKFDTSKYRPSMTDNRASISDIDRFFKDYEDLLAKYEERLREEPSEPAPEPTPEPAPEPGNLHSCLGFIFLCLIPLFTIVVLVIRKLRENAVLLYICGGFGVLGFIGCCCGALGYIQNVQNAENEKKEKIKQLKQQLKQEADSEFNSLFRDMEDRHTHDFLKKRLRWVIGHIYNLEGGKSPTSVELWSYVQQPSANVQEQEQGHEEQGQEEQKEEDGELEQNHDGSQIETDYGQNQEIELIPAQQDLSKRNQFGYDRLESNL